MCLTSLSLAACVSVEATRASMSRLEVAEVFSVAYGRNKNIELSP